MYPYRDVDDPIRLATLLRLARQGDRGALDALAAWAHPRLLRFIRSRMGVALLQRVEPEDIAQDVFVAAARSLGPSSDARHWLRRLMVCARNRIRDAARFHGRQCRAAERCVEFDGRIDAGTDDFASDTRTPSVCLSQREQWLTVARAIEELTPDQRTVLRLHDADGLDWDAVRARMGRPTIKAVQQLHRRATLALRERCAPRD